MTAAVPEPTSLAVRVLDADRDATAGPWRTWNDAHIGIAAEINDVNDPRLGGLFMPTTGCSNDHAQQLTDASLIALYRTAAPTLARRVQAVLALHRDFGQTGCAMCDCPYPCPTVRALGDDA